MVADYNRLHTAARLVAVNSHDGSDLMTRLILSKMNFSVAVLHAEFNYVLCCVGFRTLTVRVLMNRLERFNTQVALICTSRMA